MAEGECVWWSERDELQVSIPGVSPGQRAFPKLPRRVPKPYANRSRDWERGERGERGNRDRRRIKGELESPISLALSLSIFACCW